MDEIVRGSRENINYTYYSGIGMTDAEKAPVFFPEHWHMSTEFIMSVKDGCRFSVNGQEVCLQEGELLLIWPAQLHSTLESPENGHVILQFSSDLLSSCDDISMHYHGLHKLQLIGRNNPPAMDFLRTKMEECLEFYKRQEPFSETKMRLRIYECLLYLCETQLLGDPEEQPKAMAKNHETFTRIQKACNFIKNNCKEDISQKDAAAVSGFSPYYFSRIFREYTQESFTEYLTRQRIQYALSILHQEDLPITEVAYLSGFQSISNFSKVFKTVMNCSPMQYRKKHQEPGDTSEAVYAAAR